MRRIFILALLWVSCSAVINIFAQEESVFYHTVERGQTVFSIAKMYNVSAEEVFRLNIGSEDGIREGQRLRIPQKSVQSDVDAPKGDYIYHTIVTRETLYGVSNKYGVSAQSIMDANPGLTYKTFMIGKTIRIPLNVKPEKTTEIVEKPRGDKEIYYTVPTGETMFNICRTFKTSEKELLKLNPELAGGLRKGMTLRIPLRIDEQDIPKEKAPDSVEVNAMLNVKKETMPMHDAKVALLLPYDPNAPKTTAASKRLTEYYEGILLAVDSLRKMGYSSELFVYDIGDDKNQLQKILSSKEDILENVNLIIGGVTNEQIKLIADFAKKKKVKYVIPFTSKNDEVLDNSFVFQINTPQPYLYANAAYAGANLFSGYNIVFLDTKEEKDNQEEFIKTFKQELKERNISFKNTVYVDDDFEKKIISSLSTEKPSVIVLVSSSLEALKKTKAVFRSITITKPEYKITLFGYPLWQTYYEDCLDDFHALDTYIYSLFYADNMSPAVKDFYNTYKNWYSKSPSMSTYPKYAMLGFDTGMFFFSAIQQIGADFENNLAGIKYNSLQTGFNFERVNNWGGFINTNIYIIHYNKDFTITRSDFK
ncbi:MAG: LysM peptidoglycan-binding domain-containing protein [Tannerella sp.]|jgi:LysM repeat protein|nr:LysM peptidoglycan-binding domain-containing protein [Tannerella sp.]